MKFFYKGKNSWINLLTIFILLLQVFSPFFETNVFAANSEGLEIRQSIDKSIAEPGDSVTVTLDYSIHAVEGEFQNVKLSYTVPAGLTFDGEAIFSESHVKGGYTHENGIITFNFTKGGGTIRGGLSGSVQIVLNVPNPSMYPNDTVIELEAAKLRGDFDSDSGETTAKEGLSNIVYLTLKVLASWEIDKRGPAAKTIPKDPAIKYVDVDYRIQFSGGNIDLKNVVLKDTLPVGGILVKTSTHEYTLNGKELTFKALPNVNAGEDITISYTVQYPVADRNGGTGINPGDYTNNVEVVEAFSANGDALVEFLKSTDSVTTSFVASGAYWEVYRDELSYDNTKKKYYREVVIPKDQSIEKKQVSYIVGVRSVGQGNIDLGEIVLIEELPSEINADRIISMDGGTYNPTDNTITWVLSNVSVNSTTADLTRTVTLEYIVDRDSSRNLDEVWAGKTGIENKLAYQTTVNTESNAEIRLDEERDIVETRFIESTEYWYVSKSTPQSDIIFENDGADYTDYITYTISLLATNGGIDNIDLDGISIVDQLPEDVKVDEGSITDGGIYNSVDNTITWNLAEKISASAGKVLTYRLQYRKAKTPSDIEGVKPVGIDGSINPSENQRKNTVTVKDTIPSNVFQAGASTATDFNIVTFRGPNLPNPKFELKIDGYQQNAPGSIPMGNKHFNHGDEIVYTIDFDNKAGSAYEIKDVIIIDDNLPSQIEYSQVDLGTPSVDVNYTLWYKDSDDVEWQEYNGGLTQVNVADLGNGTLRGIKLKYDNIPLGFELIDKIKLIGTIDGTAKHNEIIPNAATLDYKFDHFEGLISGAQKDSSVAFKVLLSIPWITKLEKTKLTGDPGDSHNPSAIIEFKISVENDGDLATGPFKKPIIIDIVPEGFEYVDEPPIVTTSWTTSTPTPIANITPNYKGDGKTLLKWSWDEDLPVGGKMDIIYKLKITDMAIGGTHTNELYMSSKGSLWNELSLAYQYIQDAATASLIANIEEDSTDIDSNDDTTHYLVGQHAYVEVREIAAFSTSKWIKGEQDDDYSREPTVGETTPGGSVDYKLKIENKGNVYGNTIEVIDILPYIGDTAVLSDTERESEWRPYFLIKNIPGNDTNATEPGDGIVIGKDANDNEIRANVEVWYSTAFDPKRKGFSGIDDEIGSEEPNWSKDLPEDETTVQAIKFLISNFSNGKGLKPGGEIELKWNMKMPVVDPKGTIEYDKDAWNSVSVLVTTENSNQITRTLLPTEPPKVGIKVKEPVAGKGAIGNFVWFDKDVNGLQDDGHDDQKAGLNGIKARLYKEGNLIEETITGPSYSDDEGSKGIGNPGYYLFPDLDTGKEYYVEFLIPKYYSVTIMNAGDSSLDSDVNQSLEDGVDYWIARTEPFTLNGIRHDIDLGLIPFTDGSASIDLKKEAIKFKSLKNKEVAFQDTTSPNIPVNVGETITYKITLENDGTVPLFNLKLDDYMQNDGFKFTNAIRTPYNETAINYASLDEDPKLTMSSAIQDGKYIDSIVISKLDIGEKYEFFGEYKALQDDLKVGDTYTRSPIENTVKVWANELNLQSDTDTDDKYKKTVKVHLADFSIEKVISNIKKIDSSGDITPSNEKSVEVEVGDIVTYSITVTNNGSIDLSDISVNDPLLNIGQTISIPYKEKTDTNNAATIIKDYTVKEEDLPSFINTVNALDSDEDQLRYTVSDDCEVKIKHFTIKKEANISVANVDNTINYTITLENDGGAELTNITLSDNLTTGKGASHTPTIYSDAARTQELTQPIPSLAVNETKKLYAKYTITKANDIPDSNTQKITNTISATRVGYGDNASINDSLDVDIAHIELDKTETSTGPYGVGDQIHYSISIKNKGSIALSNLVVNDNKIESETIVDKAVATLQPGEASTPITGYYTVKTTDLLQGAEIKLNNEDKAKITNIASARDTKHIQNPVEDSVTVDTKGLVITKKGEKADTNKVLTIGDTVNYTITVKNIGSVDLNNVVITDSKIGLNKTIGKLASGETHIEEEAYTVTADDLAKGVIENTASADPDELEKVEDTHVLGDPKVEIEKNVIYGHDKEQYIIDNYNDILDDEFVEGLNGTPITYVFTVKNTGATNLNNIQITDLNLGVTLDNNHLIKVLSTLNGAEEFSNTVNLKNISTDTNQKLVFYYESTIDNDLTNIARVTATATYFDDSGQVQSIPDVTVVPATDDAGVNILLPEIQLEKQVFIGSYDETKGFNHNKNRGKKHVIGTDNQTITYLYTITNTGGATEPYLKDIKLVDDSLSINGAITSIEGLILRDGDENIPLAAGGSITYSYQSSITKDLSNDEAKATVTARPSKSDGSYYDIISEDYTVNSDSDVKVSKVAPAITLTKNILTADDSRDEVFKSVYREEYDDVTYVFTIENIGDTELNGITIYDELLGLNSSNQAGLVRMSGPTILSDKDSAIDNKTVVYHYETTVSDIIEKYKALNSTTIAPKSIPNTAYTIAAYYTDLSDTSHNIPTVQSELDSAKVEVIAPSILLEKTVALGKQTNIAGSQELVKDYRGKAVTYFYKIINKGDTYLNNFDITDSDLNISKTDMVFSPSNSTGEEAKALGNEEYLVYYYQTTIEKDLVAPEEEAKVIANPSDIDGNVLEGIASEIVEDTDDAEVMTLSKIGNYVWLDFDADGNQDIGEEMGIAGVTLKLLDNLGSPILDGSSQPITVITDVYGEYVFDGLMSGTYNIEVDEATINIDSEVVNPDGLVISANSHAGDTVIDNKTTVIVPITGTTDTEYIDTVDFGYKHTGKLSGFVWIDLNRDGEIDSDEGGINAIVVTLTNDSGTIESSISTYTNSDSKDGYYEFNNLSQGDYTIAVTMPDNQKLVQVSAKPDTTLDHKNSVLLAAGETKDNINFGYLYTGAIGDTIWYDLDEDGVKDNGEDGIAGATVKLVSNSDSKTYPDIITDESGKYLYQDLPKGNYTVTVVMPSEKNLEQVSDPTDNRNSNPGYVAKNTYTFGLDKGAANLNMDFGYNYTGSISGHILIDSDSDGIKDADENTFIEGAIVKLTDKSGKVTRNSITIGSTGKYLFEKLPDGDYTIEVTMIPNHLAPSYNINSNSPDSTIDNLMVVNLTPGETEENIDFGYKGVGSIKGVIWKDEKEYKVINDDEELIEGIKVTLEYVDENNNIKQIETSTSNGGKYSFDELLPREYIVKVDKSDSKLDPLLSTYIFKMDNSIVVDGSEVTSTTVTLTEEVMTQDEVNFGYRSRIPTLSLEKAADKTSVEIGDTIEYSFTVTNIGETVLTSVYLEDDMLDLITCLGDLDSGEAVYVSVYSHPQLTENLKYKVSEEDVKNPIEDQTNAYSILNRAKAYSDQTKEEVFDECEITLTTYPSLSLTKTGPQGTVNIGDEIEYTFLLTNEGDTLLHDVYLEDELISFSTYIGDLTVGQAVYESVYHTIEEEDAPIFKNIAKATSKETGEVESNEWSVDVQINPNLHFTKTGPTGPVKVGEEIQYLITVENVGDTVLESVYVEDSMLDFNYIIDNLRVGKSIELKPDTYTVTEEDFWNGLITNTAEANFTVSETVYGSVYESERVYATWKIPTIDADFNLDIEKSVDKSSANVGEVLNYTIKVTNNSTVALKDIQVRDDMIWSENKTIDYLGAGREKIFTGEYIVKTADESIGKIINIATATCGDITVSDDAETKVEKDTPDDGGNGDTGENGGSSGGGDDDDSDDDDGNEPVVPNPEPQPEPEPEQPQDPVIPVDPEQPQYPEDPTEESSDNPLGDVDIKDDGTAIYTPPEDIEVVDIVEEPTNGTIEIDEDGSIKYTPKPDYRGPDKFKIKIKDRDGNELIIEIEIPEEDIPQGTISILPQTGESRPYPYYLFGLALLMLGVYLYLESLYKRIKR